MTLSIGIVNYNTGDYLKKCIESIESNPPSFNYEIIIADNNSYDDSREYLKNIEGGDISLILNNDNKGFGRACNQIADISDSEFILFLNPDIRVTSKSIDKLINFMKNNPNTGIVTGKLLYEDGSIQYNCRKFPTILRALFGRASLLRKILPDNPVSEDYLQTNLKFENTFYPDWVRGAAILCNRKAFNRVGGFDENFFLYLEDTDLCLQIRKSGYEIACVPEAVFYHKLGASTEKDITRNTIIHNISMFKYIQKNRVYNPVFYPFILIGLLLRIYLIILVSIIKEGKL